MESQRQYPGANAERSCPPQIGHPFTPALYESPDTSATRSSAGLLSATWQRARQTSQQRYLMGTHGQPQMLPDLPSGGQRGVTIQFPSCSPKLRICRPGGPAAHADYGLRRQRGSRVTASGAVSPSRRSAARRAGGGPDGKGHQRPGPVGAWRISAQTQRWASRGRYGDQYE
jgi:hypothetical protein